MYNYVQFTMYNYVQFTMYDVQFLFCYFVICFSSPEGDWRGGFGLFHFLLPASAALHHFGIQRLPL